MTESTPLSGFFRRSSFYLERGASRASMIREERVGASPFHANALCRERAFSEILLVAGHQVLHQICHEFRIVLLDQVVDVFLLDPELLEVIG